MTAYSDLLHLRIDPQLNRLIAAAAVARGTKPSEWCRHAIRTALQLDGFDPQQDCQYALVANGELVRATFGDGSSVITSFTPVAVEQGEWLPIVDEGAAASPDVRPHYTLVSEYATPVRVVRTYPEPA
jgi:hypothetical protein